MTIDFWGLGLQAINVLILVWLLSRVFWRPVAEAITRRQQTTQSMLDKAQDTQAKADKTLSEVTKMRAGIAAEREAALTQAAVEAKITAASAREAAKQNAEKMIRAAQTEIALECTEKAKANVANVAVLSVEIASKLLGRLDTPAVRDTFLTLLTDAIAQMKGQDREALNDTVIDVVSATELPPHEKTRVTKAISDELGDLPPLRFVTDPDLIAGLELRTPHFVLHNSWQDDLKQVLKSVTDAG